MVLVKYRDDYEKTTMGLLAFLPDFHDMKHLREEMDWYQTKETRELYLWRNKHNQFTGIVGFERLPHTVLIRILALSPQERNDTTRKAILDAVSALYPDDKIMGTIATSPLIMRWLNLGGN